MMQQESYQQTHQQPQMVDEDMFRQQMEQQYYQQQAVQDPYRQQEERRLQEFQQQQQFMQQQQQHQPMYDQHYDPNYEAQMYKHHSSNKPLILHVGGLVQFPSKDPNPYAPKPPEAPHIGEEVQAKDFVRPTVLQFPSKMHDPNAKFAEGQHLGEEVQAADFVRSTVLQFPKKMHDPNARFAEGQHLGEEEHRPLLRQGGVVQFPREFKQPLDIKGYHPIDQVVKETFPSAEVEHPDHLLPSQARKQQTYITHPAHSYQRIKPAYDTPGSRRSNVQWPPQRSSVRQLPRVGFNSGHIHPEGSKHFVWPPPKPQHHRSMLDLPPAGSGPAANAWNPSDQTNGDYSSIHGYRPMTVGRIRPVWPPPERSQLRKQSSLPETRKRMLEFEEYMRHHAGIHIPPTYHAPPGTQYYETSYELVQG